MTFGEYLKQKRLEKGLTQKQAAILCGMGETQYQKYEQGKRENLSFDVAARLAFGMGFSLDDCAHTIVVVSLPKE